MYSRHIFRISLLAIIVLSLAVAVSAQDISVSTSVDFYNRYVWRGMDVAATPSIQPVLSIDGYGFELGTWGAYTISNNASESDEIDFWLSYSYDFENSVSITALVTDYYYPNAGISFFNFNNSDAVKDDTIPDPGAHTLEVGLSITGPESFPITLAGYVNVYNDSGSNTYFQVDYPIAVNETELDFFCGFAGGSKKNPGYYGTDNFNAINIGVSAIRSIDVTESFTIPFTVSFIVNPRAEISYLLVGMNF
jgi:hypothetical protein